LLGEENGVGVNGDSAEGSAYDLAIRDLSLDWYKVFGFTPIISGYGGKNLSMPAVYMGTLDSPWLSTLFDLSSCNLVGAESHCVIEQNVSLVATGNTTRGAMYTEELMGVDPWYRFSFNQPSFRGRIYVPDGFAPIHAPPAFKYRGLFTNDEDMLGYLRSDPLGKSLLDLRTASELYETILLNKANFVIPGTTTNPDKPHIALAHRRRLALAHSHFDIAGLGTFRWLDGREAPKQTYNTSLSIPT
jgi:hypothetical protein